MSQFLISVHRPHGFDHASVLDASVHHNIDVLNDEMVAAGIRVFVGGLQSPGTAMSLVRRLDGSLVETSGHHLKSTDYVDGFWVIDVATMDEAFAWGRKAAAACRASIEVRPFH